MKKLTVKGRVKAYVGTGVKFKGVTLKNRAPISNEVLKVKFAKPVESKLKNGMELIVLEDHRSPTIQVEIEMPGSKESLHCINVHLGLWARSRRFQLEWLTERIRRGRDASLAAAESWQKARVIIDDHREGSFTSSRPHQRNCAASLAHSIQAVRYEPRPS